jgi:putative transposase
MGRPTRVDVGGYAYHVLNRAAGRRLIFKTEADFAAFEAVLAEAVARAEGAVQLLAYCVMGNHWHLVLRTTVDGALSPFVQWLTLTHTQRHQVAHKRVGHGAIYQGRFKSFVIEAGEHLLAVCRYVERNAARASLVERAEDWRWSSLWRWRNPGRAEVVGDDGPPLELSAWPTAAMGTAAADGSGRPRQWLRTVNTPLSEPELAALRRSATKCRPYGDDRWASRMIERFALQSTTRNRGRPPEHE